MNVVGRNPFIAMSKPICLSAPGLDEIPFPFFKLENESPAKMIIAMMRSIFNKEIPNIWKMEKIILIQVVGDINDPGN
jgi:hypothetical protein